MTHINYVRRVARVSKMNLGQFLQPNDQSSNFAVFGGTSDERHLTTIQGMTRGCGTMGVILLHNDSAIEDRLGLLYTYKPGIYKVHCANRANNFIYDPLYGLEEADVLDAIIPFDASGAAAPSLALARAGLSDYLKIMKWQYQHEMSGFGKYPFNLDLLLSLVSMSCMQLEKRVLAFMPKEIHNELLSRLSATNVQQAVYHMVKNYAVRMEANLWKKQEKWQNHTCLSITSSVINKQVISIRIPESDADLLRCLSIEINSLIRRSVSLLLVCYGLKVTGNTILENILFNTHDNWSTGLIAPTLHSTAGENRLSDILRMNQQVVVFPCASKDEAEAFSAALGNYYRVIRPHNRGRSRRIFHILPVFNHYVGYQETEVRNVRPEELMGGSVLLTGEDTDVPILVRHLNITK